jgi:predicted outer membrane protein
MFTYRSLFLAGLSLMPLAMVQAQETGQQRRQERQERREERRDQPARTEVRVGGQASIQSSSQLDHHFVSCLRSENKAEVTIATLGSQRATNPDVKAFAQELVKDHTDFLAKLDRFSQSAGGSRDSGATTRTETRTESTNRQVSNTKDATSTKDTPPRDAPRDNARPREGAREGADNAATPARADVQVNVNRTEATRVDGGNDISGQLLQIKQEISEKCVASAQRELSSKEGAEFDKCFIGMQIGAHMHMVDSLSVLTNHASPELKQILDEGLQTSQRHLEHAKQIAKKLEGSSGNSSERATTSPNKTDRRNPENDK